MMVSPGMYQKKKRQPQARKPLKDIMESESGTASQIDLKEMDIGYNTFSDVMISVLISDKVQHPIDRLELFQLQMGFSFPFLRANHLRSSLLNIRARSFLLSCT